jgi:opacity protein-like surface antigen
MNKILLSAVLALGATTAMAAGPYGERYSGYGNPEFAPYFGVSGGLLRYDEDGLDTIVPPVVFARIGFPIVPNLAIEGRIGTGTNSVDTHGYRVEVQSFGGGYLKGSLPLSPVFSLYGVAGIGTIGLHRNFGDRSTQDTGFSFGAGGDVLLQSNVSLNFEWTRFPSGNDLGYSYDNNLLSAGVTWRF